MQRADSNDDDSQRRNEIDACRNNDAAGESQREKLAYCNCVE